MEWLFNEAPRFLRITGHRTKIPDLLKELDREANEDGGMEISASINKSRCSLVEVIEKSAHRTAIHQEEAQ